MPVGLLDMFDQSRTRREAAPANLANLRNAVEQSRSVDFGTFAAGEDCLSTEELFADSDGADVFVVRSFQPSDGSGERPV